jgi:hypothetical protein
MTGSITVKDLLEFNIMMYGLMNVIGKSFVTTVQNYKSNENN